MNKLFLLVFVVSNSFALEFSSGEKRTHLIELFTSESCSSCPPAEKWLNSLKKNDRLWKNYVPVEFHVDYWNHLHWKDKYSSKKYTKRQRSYARAMGSRTVFTPQLLLNGRRNISSSSSPPKPSEENVGKLSVKYNKKSTQASVRFEAKKEDSFICHIALLTGGHVTKVKAGENAGKTLPHEFVVAQWKMKSMTKEIKAYTCNITLDKKAFPKKGPLSLAAWISHTKSNHVAQAAGTPLTN